MTRIRGTTTVESLHGKIAVLFCATRLAKSWVIVSFAALTVWRGGARCQAWLLRLCSQQASFPGLKRPFPFFFTRWDFSVYLPALKLNGDFTFSFLIL